MSFPIAKLKASAYKTIQISTELIVPWIGLCKPLVDLCRHRPGCDFDRESPRQTYFPDVSVLYALKRDSVLHSRATSTYPQQGKTHKLKGRGGSLIEHSWSSGHPNMAVFSLENYVNSLDTSFPQYFLVAH